MLSPVFGQDQPRTPAISQTVDKTQYFQGSGGDSF